MKASDLLPGPTAPQTLPRRLCRDFEAAHYLRSAELLAELERAGWLVPTIRRHKLKLYDYRDLDTCIDRMKFQDLAQALAAVSSGEGESPSGVRSSSVSSMSASAGSR
jgi:hypothetical protein